MKIRLTDSDRAAIRIRGGRGFVLLEALMAMALFAMIAVGLTQALHQTAENAKDLRMEVQILRKLESYLTEFSKQLEFQDSEGTESLPLETFGKTEIYYTLTIEPLEEMENLDGQILENMWHIIVEAEWALENGQVMKETAETFRYEPMYQNNR